MKHASSFSQRRDLAGSRGMTLIEMSLSLALLLGMTSIVVFSMAGISDWKRARDAGLDLRAVYIAQKGYLSDHPTSDITSVVAADLLPYLPQGFSGIPAPEDLAGNILTVNYKVVPPRFSNGYDPSGATDDGLWDVGKP